MPVGNPNYYVIAVFRCLRKMNGAGFHGCCWLLEDEDEEEEMEEEMEEAGVGLGRVTGNPGSILGPLL